MPRGGAAAGRRARAGLLAPWGALGAVLLGLWAVRPFEVPSGSMRNTLLPGDHVLVASWETGLTVPGTGWRLPAPRPPRRGDVLVYRSRSRPGERLIKRCIAVGGETLEIRDKRVIVDGDTLREPYALHSDPAIRPAGYDYRDNLAPVTLAAGQLFLMGDNRDDSDDSRFQGPVEGRDVVGRAFLVYWSWDAGRGAPRWERMLRRVGAR